MVDAGHNSGVLWLMYVGYGRCVEETGRVVVEGMDWPYGVTIACYGE